MLLNLILRQLLTFGKWSDKISDPRFFRTPRNFLRPRDIFWGLRQTPVFVQRPSRWIVHQTGDMPCQNCGLDEGGFDALDGNNVCPGCGLVLEHTPLSANIEFTKVGSRFHVVGAFIKSTEDRLPIRVLNNNKVGQGSKEMYKWNRMVCISSEQESIHDDE